MECKHDIALLMGTKDGIVCRGCGKMWPDFTAYEAETAPTAETKAEPAPEKKPATKAKKSTSAKKSTKEE